MPVTNGTSSFVNRRAFVSRSRRMQSTIESSSSASNARIHSQSPSPNRARRVREDVGELAADHAVLAQVLAALLARQQVPLGRAHERIDAQVRARGLALHERRRVIRGELGRLHDPHERPGQIEETAELGPTELDERVLDGVGGRTDEPEHQVGVGPEPDRRVRAANLHGVLPRGEQLLDLGHRRARSSGSASTLRSVGVGSEHRVERVHRVGHGSSSWMTASATSPAARTTSATSAPS